MIECNKMVLEHHNIPSTHLNWIYLWNFQLQLMHYMQDTQKILVNSDIIFCYCVNLKNLVLPWHVSCSRCSNEEICHILEMTSLYISQTKQSNLYICIVWKSGWFFVKRGRGGWHLSHKSGYFILRLPQWLVVEIVD